MNKKHVKEIMTIGVPSFLEALFSTFSGIIDSKMVSAMGVTAISAVSVTNTPRLFVLSVFIALNTVVTSLVAKYMGKDDRDKANQTFDAVIRIVIILSIVFSVICVALARPIMIIVSNQPDTLDDSVIYFRIVMGGMLFNTVFMAVNAALRGCGRTNLTLSSNVLSCVVNIIFNYLLIEGHLGFPALGIAGAAIATVMGTVAAFVFVTIVACNKDLFINIPYCREKRYKITKESTAEINEMAKSTVTDGIATRVSLLLIGMVVARIGSYQMAVYSLGTQLLSINQALGTGLQTAAVSLVGRSYGAEDRQLMNDYKRTILYMGWISSVVLGLIIIAGGRAFYGFFSDEEEFIRMGAMSCLFIGVISVSQTLKFALSGCLQGIGAMKEVMKASIVSFAFVNLGVLVITVFLLKMGIWGAWTATLVAQTVQALMLWRYIKKSDAFRAEQ